ncbi:MAG: ATP-binding protein [Hyphomonadaceae bacterium]
MKPAAPGRFKDLRFDRILHAQGVRLAWPVFLRTVTFRLAFFQALIFILFAFALLGFFYYFTVGQLQRDADAAADQEFETLQQVHAKGGFRALNQEVIERAAATGPSLYVLADSTGRVISGDFQDLPKPPEAGPRLPFEYETIGQDNVIVRNRARGRIGRLSDGSILIVARDMSGTSAIVRRVTNAVWIGAAIGLVMSLVSGYFASRQAARRVEALARTARDVMAGDLTRRAPVIGADDEFDALATEFNAMLERIERLMRAARTAGDAIAHDLRTPLTRLKQRLESTLEANPETESDREALRRALEEADSLLATFNAILRLARVQSAAGWRFERVDVTAILRDLCEFYEPAAEDSGVALTAQVEEGLQAPGEASLLTQALSNLIENAVKYTPAPGRVIVSGKRREDGRIAVEVADSGPGVPPDDRERVVDRFVRLEAARSTPGAGLGLSLVAAVAAVHKADLALADGLGGETGPGLKVTFTLPMLAARG